jgi:hypothetical protein
MHSSHVTGVSEAIFDSATSQLSLTVYESTGLWWLMNPFGTCEKRFGGYILLGSESVFIDSV